MKFVVWSDLAPRPGADQMALDHALLGLAATDGVPVLRLYRWDRDTISFGTNEAALGTWDRSRLESAGLPCVRRPTGGRAVWPAPNQEKSATFTPSRGSSTLAIR